MLSIYLGAPPEQARLMVFEFKESWSYCAKLTPGERFKPSQLLNCDPYSIRIWGFLAFKNGW